jgi:hypothetical protein
MLIKVPQVKTLGTVFHGCNPSSRNQTSLGFCFIDNKARGYKDPISANKLGKVVHNCHPNYLGGISRRIMAQPKTKPNLKNNLKQKGLRVWRANARP